MTETAGSPRDPAATESPTVLVTGGSRGLGLELCRHYAARGARVALCGRDEVALERARVELSASGASVLAVACDVADANAVGRLVETVTERFGGVDVLVNNASVMTVGPVELQGTEEIERLMDVAFWGGVHASFAVLPAMRARRSGTIVNVTSIGGRVSTPHLAAYSAAQAAFFSFSRGLAPQERRPGGQGGTVVPGFLRTGSGGRARYPGDEEAEPHADGRVRRGGLRARAEHEERGLDPFPEHDQEGEGDEPHEPAAVQVRVDALPDVHGEVLRGLHHPEDHGSQDDHGEDEREALEGGLCGPLEHGPQREEDPGQGRARGERAGRAAVDVPPQARLPDLHKVSQDDPDDEGRFEPLPEADDDSGCQTCGRHVRLSGREGVYNGVLFNS